MALRPPAGCRGQIGGCRVVRSPSCSGVPPEEGTLHTPGFQVLLPALGTEQRGGGKPGWGVGGGCSASSCCPGQSKQDGEGTQKQLSSHSIKPLCRWEAGCGEPVHTDARLLVLIQLVATGAGAEGPRTAVAAAMRAAPIVGLTAVHDLHLDTCEETASRDVGWGLGDPCRWSSLAPAARPWPPGPSYWETGSTQLLGWGALEHSAGFPTPLFKPTQPHTQHSLALGRKAPPLGQPTACQ